MNEEKHLLLPMDLQLFADEPKSDELNADNSNESVFFFNDTATTEIYTLSLHDALPICSVIGIANQIESAPRVAGST